MKIRSMTACAFALAWAFACSTANNAGTGGAGADAGGPTGSPLDGSTMPGDAASLADAAMCPPGTNFQTDAENCGHCGKSCSGASCLSGLCEATLVMSAPQPNSFGLGKTFAYTGFVSGGKVSVWEEAESGDHYDLLSALTTPTAPPSAGSPPLQTTNLPPFAGAVAFDATNVYEAFQPAAAGQTGQVLVKKLADAAAPTKMFTLPASNVDWTNIAVGPTAIYLTATTAFTSTAIYRMATPVADAASMPTLILDHLGEKDSDLSVVTDASGGEHLVWLDYLATRPDSDAGLGSDWFVYTAPATPGATPVRLGDATTSTASIASDGTFVYWTEANDAGRLMRCPLANLDAAHAVRVADVASAQEGIVVQGSYAWVMELSDPGPIFRIDTSSGAKELVGNRTVGASIKNSYLFGIDASFIYMASVDGPVYRLPSAP
jgi:hypothetical protein